VQRRPSELAPDKIEIVISCSRLRSVKRECEKRDCIYGGGR
jgi:hypothetical protein